MGEVIREATWRDERSIKIQYDRKGCADRRVGRPLYGKAVAADEPASFYQREISSGCYDRCVAGGFPCFVCFSRIIRRR